MDFVGSASSPSPCSLCCSRWCIRLRRAQRSCPRRDLGDRRHRSLGGQLVPRPRQVGM